MADHDGYTPLHAAVIGRAPECAALLVEHGFDCNATNRYLQVRVRRLCTSPQAPYLPHISPISPPHLPHISPVSPLQTPLHLAARLGSYDAAQLLLGYGADPLRRDERNQQARHAAHTYTSPSPSPSPSPSHPYPSPSPSLNPHQAWQVTERSLDRPELTRLLREATEAAQASHPSAQGNGGTRATGSTAPACRRARSRRRNQRTSAGGAGGSEATTV